MRNLRAFIATCALAFLVVAGAQAQPAITTINGSPLKVNVGSDGSFQVYNVAFPGLGQIYPTSASLADMGLFAWVDGALYAPDFGSHGGTATSSLGTYTPWTSTGLSALTGDGSPENPYLVTVSLRAGDLGLTAKMIVTYVNGNNFFRLESQFFSEREPRPVVDAILGADIYLAGSDNGIFVTVPQLAAVGGRNCVPEEGEYNILLIPVTPAQSYTTADFSEVWRQIGVNTFESVPPVGCIDNGAALKWTNVMQNGPAVQLSTAVSFGAIPDPSNFFGFSIDVEPDFVSLQPGDSVALEISTRHNPELGFNAPIALSAGDLPHGMSITFEDNVIEAPGTGTTHATLHVGTDVFPRLYPNLFIAGSGGSETRLGGFGVEILCTPPYILGTEQPKMTLVNRGQPATLSVTVSGGGVHAYQWYEGLPGMTRTPVANGTAASLTTGPVTAPKLYWVRVANQCGSVDSTAAWVFPRNN